VLCRGSRGGFREKRGKRMREIGGERKIREMWKK